MPPIPSADTAVRFFEAVFPALEELTGLLCVFLLPSRQARYFRSCREAAEWAAAQAGAENVYFSVSLFRERPASGRGNEALAAGIPGLWADIDIRGAAHKADNLPPTVDDAKALLATIELQPTLLVHSGHGLQAYWLFKEFWAFESEQDAARAKSLCVRWQAMLRRIAQARGWTIDPTADLARVLRVPGTINRKLPGALRSVRFRAAGEHYSIAALEDLVFDVAEEPDPPAAAAGKGDRDSGEPADLAPALEGCAWLRHCRDDAATLPEPEWYQLLTVVVRCREAEKWAHNLSKPYPKYTAAETAEKLKHAREQSPGPVTCRFVELNFGQAQRCTLCPHQGRIKSPIQLGRKRPAQAPPGDPPPAPGERPATAAENLEQSLESAFQKHDLPAIYELVQAIAAMPKVGYELLRTRLQREFGRECRIRDLDLAVRAERLKAKAAARPNSGETPDWRGGLHYKDGMPRPILANALRALREAPEWEGVLAYDEFSQIVVARKDPPWGMRVGKEWTDNDDRLVAEWLQEQRIYVSAEIAGQAVQTVALEHPFHPVREYLGALNWDGERRILSWSTKYLGTEDTFYARSVGEKWLISAVARIYMPGCKADCALILEGEQGIKKSTTLRILGGDWFTDEISDLGTKDAALQVQGAWIIEISELDGLTRAEVSAIKSFMSRSVDRFRPPYGKRLIESPRSCVFGGTVNHNLWGRDETGGRRFWPIACPGSIDTDGLARDRDQLWAEAVHEYRAGSRWWIENRSVAVEAAEEARARYQPDPWDPAIHEWLRNRERAGVAQILEEVIQKPRFQQQQGDANRVARSLRAAGWIRKRSSDPDRDGRRPYVYLNPEYAD